MSAKESPSSRQKEYVKVANAPGLDRHVRTGRYHGVKKINGKHREHSLGTSDRKIAERRHQDWVANLTKIDSEAEKTTLDQLPSTARIKTGPGRPSGKALPQKES